MAGVLATLYKPAYALYEGVGVTSEVPGLWDVAIGGIGYRVDWAVGIRPVSIPEIRAQADSAQRPGEGSLNPEALWRRSQVSWHRGAGQRFLDRDDSDPFRFRTSQGFDVFSEPYQLTVLDQTEEKLGVDAGVAPLMAVGDGKVFIVSGATTVHYTTDIPASIAAPTFTDTTIQAGESATNVEALTTDGHNLYAALGTNGIHRSVDGAAATHYNDLAATLVRWAKGRLMAAKTDSLYNVTASGAAPAALMTHDNSDFRWQDVTGGRSYIYAGGFSGDKSEIWKTAVQPDGTALATPSPAGELPDGEILRSMVGYLGFVLIGTDSGVRLATEGDDGNLTIGALVDLGVSVRCFEPQGRFVWFGWSNFTSDDTGLGRLDLTQILPGGAPAYASDLMAGGKQGVVASVVTFQGRRVFGVTGEGVYGLDGNKVVSATLDSGFVSFGIPEQKTALFLDYRHHHIGLGSVDPALSVDGGAFVNVAGSTSGVGRRSGTGHARGELFEVRLAATRKSTPEVGATVLGQASRLGIPSDAPTLLRWTLLADLSGSSAYFVDVPVVLAPTYELAGGQKVSRDPEADLQRFLDLRDSGQAVTYQRGPRVVTARVVAFDGRLEKQVTTDPAKPELAGTVTVRLKVVE